MSRGRLTPRDQYAVRRAGRVRATRSIRTPPSPSAGWSSATASSSPSTGWTSTSAAARSSRCSAPTAPARRRRSRSARATAAATPARCGCSARTRPTARRRWKAQLGIVLQSGAGDSQLTCRELLHGAGLLLPRPARPRRGARAGRADREGEVAGPKTLSGGQRRRLDVALGIVGRPTLLFLDEPTTGFDPEARRQFWSLIRSLRELGTTMLLTTHYLDEAEALADRVGVIARGRLVEVAVPAVLGRPGDRARRRHAGPRTASGGAPRPPRPRRSCGSWPAGSPARCPTSPSPGRPSRTSTCG